MQPARESYRLTTHCPSCLRPRAQQALIAMDRAPPSARSAFIRAKKLENEYTRRLRSVARHIGDLVRGFDVTNLGVTDKLRAALDRYSHTLRPWAEAVGSRMVAEVAQRDERSWFRVANQMGESLRKEIATAPIGEVVRERQSEQVRLITSLPLEAAERVHHMTREGIVKGWRADQIAAEIMRTGEVTKARADLIARTEVGRTSTLLTQARAEHVGSPGYTWITAGDSDVRASHKAMNGKFVAWDAPPTLDGLTGHAGAIPNCRCYCSPVIEDL